MVTGLFALLYGVKPGAVHNWYLAMYADAIAWVEVPNTLGMSQFADGGRGGFQALYRQRKLHPEDVELLRALSLQPQTRPW